MVYIDVRTKSEYEGGHFPGAINLDLQDIALGDMPDVPKDEELKLYCRSGGRAQTAKGLLEEYGFTNVTNVGGLSDIK